VSLLKLLLSLILAFQMNVTADNLQPESDRHKPVPILMYHAVTEDPAVAAANSLYITTGALERQIREILEQGYTPIFAKDLNQPLPEKPIVITFDDGYLDNYTLAFPILQQYEAKATIFVIGRHLDDGFRNFFTWEQAREMLASGLVDIQSHTYDLHREPFLVRRDHLSAGQHRELILGDAVRLGAAFVRELGYFPSVIAYPHGLYDQHTLDIYQDIFRFGLTVEHGTAYLRNNPLTLPRVRMVERSAIPRIP
jgi:peptidoglycan/xylan/chitin deacetylase (PgdA/CDA1 family)